MFGAYFLATTFHLDQPMKDHVEGNYVGVPGAQLQKPQLKSIRVVTIAQGTVFFLFEVSRMENNVHVIDNKTNKPIFDCRRVRLDAGDHFIFYAGSGTQIHHALVAPWGRVAWCVNDMTIVKTAELSAQA